MEKSGLEVTNYDVRIIKVRSEMESGLYAATSENKPDTLITSGCYRRRRGEGGVWHTLTLSTPTLIEKDRNYCVVFRMKKGGLLHSFQWYQKEDTWFTSFAFKKTNEESR